MDRHRSLRASILITLGAAGCSGAGAPGGGEAAVVTIPSAAGPGSAAADPPDPEELGRARPPRTGWVTEKDGTVHRASRARCDPAIESASCNGTESRLLCKTDADCKEGPRGKCITGIGQIGTYCGCTYACATDADCGEGEACVCKGTGGLREPHAVCARAECSVDADCAEGACGLSTYFNGCGEEVRLACRSRDDACRTDADCAKPGAHRLSSCVAISRGDAARSTWQCASESCVIGRPLVVLGAARAAAPAARADWTEAAAIRADAIDPGAREALARHYTAQAAMEHASVASFARFTLQLLALGAPADLVAEAQRAALDEVDHARIAYGLAAALAGRSIGPGRLPEAAAPIAADVPEVVEALVEEGCVGETLGAAEGREIARHAGDPALARAFDRIAADEERHAALAWRTLRWMIDAFGDAARAAADRAFTRAMERCAADPPEGPAAHEALGLLPARALGALRREVLAEVVDPCRAALGLRARSRLFQG